MPPPPPQIVIIVLNEKNIELILQKVALEINILIQHCI